MSHIWVGDVGFVAHDTELDLLLQDARIRKNLKDEGVLHYALFAIVENPDGTTPETKNFSRLLLSEDTIGNGEAIYAATLLKALMYHLELQFGPKDDNPHSL